MISDIRIETERLLIRAYTESDLQECFQLTSKISTSDKPYIRWIESSTIV